MTFRFKLFLFWFFFLFAIGISILSSSPGRAADWTTAVIVASSILAILVLFIPEKKKFTLTSNKNIFLN